MNRWWLWCALALCFAVVVTSWVAVSTSHAREPLDGLLYWPSYHAAQAAARDQLTDPDSTEFRDLYFHKYFGMQVMCGELNSRNRMGGYVGFRPFYVYPGGSLSTAVLFHVGSSRTFTDITDACGHP